MRRDGLTAVVVHAGHIQHAAAQTRQRLGAEQRDLITRQHHPRGENRIAFRSHSEAPDGRVRQQAICGLQNDEHHEQGTRPHALERASPMPATAPKIVGFS